MAVTMRETLRTMLLTDMESISISMDINMRVSGRIICPMGKGRLNIPMAVGIMDSF